MDLKPIFQNVLDGQADTVVSGVKAVDLVTSLGRQP